MAKENKCESSIPKRSYTCGDCTKCDPDLKQVKDNMNQKEKCVEENIKICKTPRQDVIGNLQISEEFEKNSGYEINKCDPDLKPVKDNMDQKEKWIEENIDICKTSRQHVKGNLQISDEFEGNSGSEINSKFDEFSINDLPSSVILKV